MFCQVDGATLDTHYEHIADKPFYPEVSEYMRSGPVLQLVFQGLNACSAGRALLGATNPLDAPIGTVRGDFGLSIDEVFCLSVGLFIDEVFCLSVGLLGR